MYLTIKALVLRVTNYNDTDALLSVLTHSHGKLTLKARGVRRKNSPLIAACQLLAFSEFTVFEYRDMCTINEARTIELFQGLRKDIQMLSLGTYFAQVAEVVCQEDMPNPELLSLTLNSLYAVSAMKLDERLVRAVFELRCACLAGYTPDLSGCSKCASPDCVLFDLRAGQLLCNNCCKTDSDGIRMPINPGVVDAMQYICTCDAKQIFSFQAGDQTMNCLSQITELYIATQLERGFSTLDFYKSLLYMP